jgi:hypothetical protein
MRLTKNQKRQRKVENLVRQHPSVLNSNSKGKLHTKDYLKLIGVPELLPTTSPFDPGYDLMTLKSHIEQSHHLMSILKISMACWIIADEKAT